MNKSTDGITPIVKTEIYDVEALNTLSRHDGVDKETKRILNKYKKKSEDGNKVKVNYLFPSKYSKEQIGRVYAEKGLSLQNFRKDIRNALAAKYYWDLDICNAHCTFLLKICNDKGWKSPLLDNFVKQRELFRKYVMDHYDIDEEEAKEMILVTMYLGNVYFDPNKGKCQLLVDFSDELKNIAENIKETYRHIYKKTTKETNRESSCMALVLQTEEHKCISHIDQFFTNNNRDVGVLIFDGCLVRKLDGEEEFDPELLRGCEQFIKQVLNYDIKLKARALRSTFIIDNDIPTVSHMNDDIAAGHLYKYMKNKIVKSNDEYWVYDDTTGMWSDDYDILKRAVHKHSKHLLFNIYDENDKKSSIRDYGGMVYNIDRMIQCLSNYCLKDNNFIEKNIDTTRNKLLFTDGIYDFNTDTFTKGFDHKVVFIYNINKPFVHERNQNNIDLIYKLLFQDPFDENDIEMVNELLKHLACSIAGNFRSKKFRIVVGSKGDSGKGTLCDCISATFEDFVDSFNGANLFDKSNQNTDDEKKNLFKLDMAYKKMVYSHEINMTGSLDGNAIKSISSGGDEFKGRYNFKDPIKRKVRAQAWLFLNDVPKIKPYDESIDQKLSCFEYKYCFKPHPNPNNPREKLQDDTIKDLFINIDYQYALLDIIIDAYKNYKIENFIDVQSMIDAKKNWLQVENALLFVLVDGFEITRNCDDHVPFKSIFDFVISKGLQITKTKLGLELSDLGFNSDDIRINNKTTKIRIGLKNKTDLLN